MSRMLCLFAYTAGAAMLWAATPLAVEAQPQPQPGQPGQQPPAQQLPQTPPQPRTPAQPGQQGQQPPPGQPQQQGPAQQGQQQPPDQPPQQGQAAQQGQAPAQEPTQLWADFNHYMLIARLDLAAASGQALLNQQMASGRLLEIVESSDYSDQYQDVLDRAAGNDATRQVAQQLRQRIQQARIDASQDPQRIQRNIERLTQGSRAYRNAVERLSAAGQFAAPMMLKTLANPDQQDLHPFVINAMVAVGKPLVAPLTVALPNLEPAMQGRIAQVLARIGDPWPVPTLKEMAGDQQVSQTVRQQARQAYERLQANADYPPSASAARLHLLKGQNLYRKATASVKQIMGFNQEMGKGIVWAYGRNAGLINIPVPGPIYGDVLAMRSARSALRLNPQMSPALSLYLMANLRRENRLPQGANDPTYGQNMRPPRFYAMVAGPPRLHEVLSQALDDSDPGLALDAINILSQTAGTAALVRGEQSTQPLVRALQYPDRRVRFRAAEALAQARPTESFDAASRVVPALAEVVRPQQTRYALVLSSSQNRRNQLMSMLNEMGFEAFGGRSLAEVRTQVQDRAGVDLIVTTQSVGSIRDLVQQTATSRMLAGSTILALASQGDQIRVNSEFSNQPRVRAAAARQPEAVRSAVQEALSAYGGGELSDRQRTQYALRALTLLRQLAIASTVYDVTDVQSVLTGALDDQRPRVVQAAGRVLAVLDTQQAQRALAERALAIQGGQVKVALLRSLAESATAFGNKLQRSQNQRLTQLVGQSSGEIAVAAAQAHGALQLPTSQAVQLIVGEPAGGNGNNTAGGGNTGGDSGGTNAASPTTGGGDNTTNASENAGPNDADAHGGNNAQPGNMDGGGPNAGDASSGSATGAESNP